MQNTVYIKESHDAEGKTVVVYSTLTNLLESEGMGEMYKVVQMRLLGGKPFIYGKTIIRKTKFIHYERRGNHGGYRGTTGNRDRSSIASGD